MTRSTEEVHVAQIIPCTEAEGPGRRFAIWFQGCPFRCPSCCNPEMLPFDGGVITTIRVIREQLSQSACDNRLDGISLLGGEPFAHPQSVLEITAIAKELNLSVMIYTGYTLDELQQQGSALVEQILQQTDILVDGRFEQSLPETQRRWIGSTNQQIHFLSDRYSMNDPCWSMPNTMELRLHNGQLTVNGFPVRHLKSFWQNPVPSVRKNQQTAPSGRVAQSVHSDAGFSESGDARESGELPQGSP